MKGVTLLETVVVIAVISVLSVMGVNTINNFRKEAALDNAANEMVSMIRFARSKSMNGEVLEGEAENDFEVVAEDGSSDYELPEYGISIKSDEYQLVRRCIKNGVDCVDEEPLERIYLGDDYVLDPEGTYYFARIKGTSSPQTINIIEKGGSAGREIKISEDFEIGIEKI